MRPLATYRVQLSSALTFEDVRGLVDYLARLGISHLYTSPFLRARAHSSHGYDVVDHHEISEALGGAAELRRLSTDLRARDMGWIADFVPNHMSTDCPSNRWWYDVLKNGRTSRFAGYFDIDWSPRNPKLEHKVLLPILKDHYGTTIESGGLTLALESGEFVIHYGDQTLPISPHSYYDILDPVVDELRRQTETADADELERIARQLRSVAKWTTVNAAQAEAREAEARELSHKLDALMHASPNLASAVQGRISHLNGIVGDPNSYDSLHALLELQHYRLSYWRVAAHEVNYRRFFDINDLVAIRMDNPEVFDSAHRLLLELLGDGTIDGLRLDHPDGLWDPLRYCEALQDAYRLARRSESPAGYAGPTSMLLYVEKVLARGETLPPEWPVNGTTGYDFATAAGQLLIDASAEAAITRIYQDYTGERRSFEDLVQQNKKLVLSATLASEVNLLTDALSRLSERDRHTRDFSSGALRDALTEVIAAFPIYRTYIRRDTVAPSAHDRAAIAIAIRIARRHSHTTDSSIFEYFRRMWLLECLPSTAKEDLPAWRSLVMRMQQLTAPVMAKAVEDTVYYVYNRLTGLNEVGGEPERFGISTGEFHRMNSERQRSWPTAMLTTTTHDTKRSEDVRARIATLSEVPDFWQSTLRDVAARAAPHTSELDGWLAPDHNEQILLYQTILGTLPPAPSANAMSGLAKEQYAARLTAYMQKAVREAKVNMSWVDARPEYDQALERFVRGVLRPDVLEALFPLAQLVTYHGYWNSLTQVLLKCACPGVADIYQGSELWDYSLVDPDNRRTVDFAARKRALEEISSVPDAKRADFARQLVRSPADGRIKLYVLYRALNLKRQFERGEQQVDYSALEARGARAIHAVAAIRAHGSERLISVAPRLPVTLAQRRFDPPVGKLWKDTELDLPPGGYRNVFTGEWLAVGGSGVPLSDLLANFPVALLYSTGKE